MPNGVGIGAAAGEQTAFRRGMAGDAVAGAGEIFAARDDVAGLVLRLRGRGERGEGAGNLMTGA